MPEPNPGPEIDVIDAIAGIRSGSPTAAIRNKKPELVVGAQAYHDALFAPADPGDLPLGERALIAIRAASHTRSSASVAWYEALARESGVEQDAITRIQSTEPSFPTDPRWSEIIRHVDHLAGEPASSSPHDLDALSAVGVSPSAIVTLSQIVAFIAYQVRVVAGLRALGESS